MDGGRVVDRQDVGAGVDGEHQLGAAEDDRLHLLLGQLGDQSLQLALAVADDAAGGELFVDDAVDLGPIHCVVRFVNDDVPRAS